VSEYSDAEKAAIATLGLPRTLKALLVTASLLVVVIASVAWCEPGQQAEGAGELTLSAAIDEGLKRSPDVQRARAAADESHWHRLSAFGGGFLPRLSVSAHHYFNEQYTSTSINFGGAVLSFPGFFPTDMAVLEMQIPVFDGFASVHGLEAASLMEDASNKDRTQVEFQLRQDIRLAFYKALAASELQAVAEQNVKTLEDHLNQVNVQRNGGVATKYDSLRVEVLLSEAKADAIDAIDSFVLARKKLTQLMGLDGDERRLVDSLPVPDVSRVKNLELDESLGDRADIQALSLRAEAAKRSQSAAQAWLVPQIYFGGEYIGYQEQVVDTQVRDTGVYGTAWDLGIFLKWNLFDGGVSYALQQEVAFRQIQAEKASQAAKLQVPYDFVYWKRRYLSNTDHYLSKKFDIKRSDESVRLAKEEERAGSRTSTETLDAELDLFRSRAGVVSAQLNAIEAQIHLELALGREI
jgi:outer membrane protein TolC